MEIEYDRVGVRITDEVYSRVAVQLNFTFVDLFRMCSVVYSRIAVQQNFIVEVYSKVAVQLNFTVVDLLPYSRVAVHFSIEYLTFICSFFWSILHRLCQKMRMVKEVFHELI